MSSKFLVGLCVVCIAIVGIRVVQRINHDTNSSVAELAGNQESRQLIFVGDTQDRVYEMLGQPSIEFPEGGTMIQWYAGYEVVISNGVVNYVRMKPVESEEERLEKEHRAKLAEKRLQNAYQTMADKEEISYNAWLVREELRLQKEREERASVEAYEERRSNEKKAAIYADAIRKSCGCRHGHYCRHCR